jgi:hypothetical protein
VYDAVKNARDHGDLFVAAAGNFGQNNDVTNFTPAIYTRNSSAGPALDNVIAVAATDQPDGLAGFSDYGPHSVQLGAPGVNILSTFPVDRGSYAYDSGTSMAAPHVAGAAALLWGFRPDLTYLDIKNALLNGVDPIASLNGNTTTGGRLDVFKSLELVALPAGPTVVGSTPTGSTLAPINSIRFTFDTAINPDTFTTDQVRTFTGPGGVDLLNTVAAVAPVSGSNGMQFDVSFTMPLDSQGDYSMQIGPHILDTADRPMDQNRNGIAGEDPGDRYTATFSLVGPLVASASPSGFVLPPVDHVRVTFNEPMDPATFTPNQVSFTGPGGAIVVAGVTPVDGSNNTQFDVGFDTQTALGAYTMVIGPGIMDPLGNSAPQFTDPFTLSPIPLNGGFEAGDFTGWTTIGSTAIKTASFGTGPTEGTFDALITNDSGPDHTTVESFLGLDANALTSLVSNVTNGSVIQQTINVSAGSTLTFDWNFLTNEAVSATLYRDFSFLSITPVGAGGTLVKLADTTSPLVDAPSATGFFYMSGFSTFTFTFTLDGTYILGVGAMNAGDQNINSALLVDNFQITPPPRPTPTPPPRFARALVVGGPGAAPTSAAFAPTAQLGFAGADTAGAESVQPASDHNDLVFTPDQSNRRRVAISMLRGQGQPHGSDAFDPFAGPAGADSWWWV